MSKLMDTRTICDILKVAYFPTEFSRKSYNYFNCIQNCYSSLNSIQNKSKKKSHKNFKDIQNSLRSSTLIEYGIV